MNKDVVYEVGTFEKYEEGFHAFYRTQNKEKALSVLGLAREFLNRVPTLDFNCSDEELSAHIESCRKLDAEFKEAANITGFSISNYCGGLYTIEMHEEQLD
ncbi:hypothetical protein ACVCFZ_05245 [Acinetobacter variabilis]